MIEARKSRLMLTGRSGPLALGVAALFAMLSFGALRAHAETAPGQTLAAQATPAAASKPSDGKAPPVPDRISADDVLDPAKSSERIVAVVNDEIITTSDIRARLALSLLTSGLPANEDNERHLLPQVLRELIDEHLQMQEAKSDGIAADKADEQKIYDKIAHDNNVPDGQINLFLASHGIPFGTLQNQVDAYLVWSKVVQTKLRPLVEVGDEEIQSRIDRVKANEGKPEYLLAEIFLAVDQPRDEARIESLAVGLVGQIRAGANFASTAQQFSQGAGAQQGGDLGWIVQGQLTPELDRKLADLQKGQVSDPIRAADGYHILLLRDERTVTLDNPADTRFKLAKFTLPFSALPSQSSGLMGAASAATDTGSAGDTIMRIGRRPGEGLNALTSTPAASNGPDQQTQAKADAEKLRAALTGCDKAEAEAKALNASWQYESLDNWRIGDAQPQVQQIIAPLKIGAMTVPLLSDKDVTVILVCDRKDSTGGPDKEYIANAIGAEKLDMQARRLLRDLRRDAIIDIRLN